MSPVVTNLYVPFVDASVGGGQIAGARVETSFSDPVSKGYVKFYADPGGWSVGDDISISIGAGSHNVQCFQGTIMEGDYLNSGPTFEIVARGPLIAAQKFRNNQPKGYTITDLCGGPATDNAIVAAVLDIAGVGNIGSIGGTGIVRGASAPPAYTWNKGESALEYLQRLSKACIGYKIIESTDTRVYWTQVLTGGASGADMALTEGVDIFEGAHTQIEIFDRYTAWDVTGFDYGDGLGPVYNREPDPIPNGSTAYAFSSTMIERTTDSDPRLGISCETVKNYLKGETSSPITKVSGLQTPRDDLVGPGSVVSVDSDLLGVHGDFWVISCTREVTQDWFIQTLELAG
jgi:hypothetical protein